MSGMEPDPEFGAAWIDQDEVREEPLPHRYLHGGFEGTTTRFRIRLPAEGYRGRMIQLLGGGQGGTELLTDYEEADGVTPHRMLVQAAARGAFLVESNEGFRAGTDPVPEDLTITAYRATAHTAWYAARLAEEHYGRAPEYRYVTGWSGGGNRTVNALERVPGLFHGGVGGGLTTMEIAVAAWSVVAEAAHVLRDVVEDVAAGADAGGTADPLAAVDTDEQRDALAGLYRVGFPLGNERRLASGFAWVPGWHYLGYSDPDYLRDFFEVPGYAGHEGLVDRVAGEATVVAIDEADGVVGLRLDAARAPEDLVGTLLTVRDGERAGGTALVTGRTGDVLHPVGAFGPAVVFEVGDRLTFDNARWLALRHYHRDAARRPAARYAASLEYTGSFAGKLLLIHTVHDHLALTSTADAYVRRVAEPSGFRHWWIENADHGGPAPGPAAARHVGFSGAMIDALDDVIAWVEEGREPAPSTVYDFDAYGVLRMPPGASERRGIQPTVTLEADGARRAETAAGDAVAFRASAEAPAGAEIVELAWDLDGTGDWRTEPASGRSVVAEARHTYPEPGTVLAGVRVRSRRAGSEETVENLSHARIAVH